MRDGPVSLRRVIGNNIPSPSHTSHEDPSPSIFVRIGAPPSTDAQIQVIEWYMMDKWKVSGILWLE